MTSLITILTDPVAYSDRLASIEAMSEHVDRNVVLCKAIEDVQRERYPHITFFSPRPALNSWRYFLWAAKKAKRLSSECEGEWYIMEIATSITLCLLRWRWRSRAVLVQQLVFPARTFLRNRGWTDDVYAPRIGIRQWLSWYWISLRQCLLLSVSKRVCDGFVSNAAQSAEELVGCDAQARVVPNCVTQALDRKTGARRAEEFLMVTAIQPHKGIGIALEAFRHVRLAGYNCSLSLAGRIAKRDRSWFQRLQRQYADIWPNVDLLGAVDRTKLDELYATSGALVLTSLYEGSPRVVYESLSNGCPVIASDIPGIREIAPGHPWVSLFPAADPKSCAHEMLSCLSPHQGTDASEEDQMINYVTEHYSPDARARRLIEALREIVSRDAKESRDDPVNPPRSNRLKIGA